MSRFDSPLKDVLRRGGNARAIEETWARIDATRSRRGRSVLWISLAAGAALAIALFVFRTREVSPLAQRGGAVLDESVATAVSNDESKLFFDDGSVLTKSSKSTLHLSENAKGRIGWALENGRVSFDVKPRGPRTWIVNAGIATVTVLGTSFVVDRAADHVHVEVSRGRVRVSSALLEGGERLLTAGESVDLAVAPQVPPEPQPGIEAVQARADAGAASGVEVNREAPGASSAVRAPTLPVESPAEWKELARKGEYSVAYDHLSNERFSKEVEHTQSTEELMMLADIARISGHAADAVAPLKKVIARKSPEAATAAFTLATLQNESLGNPAEAAHWFQVALEQGLSKALREDALARRVDSLGRSGQRDAAATEAAAYMNEFASGRYVSLVKPWAAAK